MSPHELTWEPPGPGQWYAAPEHMPTPVTRLFARIELRRWHDDVRPATVAINRALLAEDLPTMSDDGLADHVERAIAHFVDRGPLHFAALEGTAAGGALLEAAEAWNLDPRAILEALAGQATASSHLTATPA